jgi:hypothetical protein
MLINQPLEKGKIPAENGALEREEAEYLSKPKVAATKLRAIMKPR